MPFPAHQNVLPFVCLGVRCVALPEGGKIRKPIYMSIKIIFFRKFGILGVVCICNRNEMVKMDNVKTIGVVRGQWNWLVKLASTNSWDILPLIIL